MHIILGVAFAKEWKLYMFNELLVRDGNIHDIWNEHVNYSDICAFCSLFWKEEKKAVPVKFQSDWKSLKPNLATSRLREILR